MADRVTLVSNPNPMLVTYDPQYDAAYIYFDGTPRFGVLLNTVRINEVMLVDFDASTGKLMGMEILDAAGILPENLLKAAVHPDANPDADANKGGDE